MATTTAKTKKDVDEMSAADRLYDSLSYSYGKKGENISKNYNQAISQTDRGLLQRGMQRSSYGAQAIANLYKQRNDALNDNDSEMIATYEKMKADIEAKEQEQANWQAQFDANQAAQKWQQDFSERQFDASQAAQAWQQGMTEKQFEASQAETAWNQAFQTQQFEANQAAQAWEQEYKDRAFDADQAAQAWQQDFSERQWQAQVEQWEKNYNYQAMSDDRKYNFELVMSAIENGKDISDDALAKAGISREDFNNMKTEAAITGSGGYGGYNPAANETPGDEEEGNPNSVGSRVSSFLQGLGLGESTSSNYQANNLSSTKKTLDNKQSNFTSYLNESNKQKRSRELSNEVYRIKSQMQTTDDPKTYDSLSKRLDELTNEYNNLMK